MNQNKLKFNTGQTRIEKRHVKYSIEKHIMDFNPNKNRTNQLNQTRNKNI